MELEGETSFRAIDAGSGFSKPFGPGSTLFVELDRDGGSVREVGVDVAGRIIHRCPDERFPDGQYGVLDYPPELDEGLVISRITFDEVWDRVVV